MATQVHARLLTAAGRSILKPIGLIQKGQRRWLDDRGWWVCIVDFEPGSTKGTYLTVAADFLWHERDWLAYSAGGRLGTGDGHSVWVDFESEAQFAPESERLARRASEEVLLYRARFQTLADWATVFAERAEGGNWKSFDAAVAHGLMGQRQSGEHWFDVYCNAIESDSEASDWELTSAARARRLQALVGDTQRFRGVIADDVQRFRDALRLPDALIAFD